MNPALGDKTGITSRLAIVQKKREVIKRKVLRETHALGPLLRRFRLLLARIRRRQGKLFDNIQRQQGGYQKRNQHSDDGSQWMPAP